MRDNEVLIRYGEKSKMRLKMDCLFPRTKGWLSEFERKVLRYCPDRDEVLDRLIAYLRDVKIPGLPKELAALDRLIETVHAHMVSLPTKSWERENAEYEYRRLKSRKTQWPKYCQLHDMNLEVLEGYRRGNLH